MTKTPTQHEHHHVDGRATSVTTILHVGNLHWATEKAVVEAVLRRVPGVELIEANPVAQTATVTYDPKATSVAELRQWIERCGFHCAGQSVPEHLCHAMQEPDTDAPEGQDANERSHDAPVPETHAAHTGEHRSKIFAKENQPGEM